MQALGGKNTPALITLVVIELSCYKYMLIHKKENPNSTILSTKGNGKGKGRGRH
jgi:hypothetical protein